MEDKVNVGMEDKPLVHSFNNTESLKASFTPKVMILLVVVVVIGVVSGYFIAGKNGASATGGTISGIGSILNASSVKSGTIVGSNDTTTFKDTAEGTLQSGGINGEGAFHLVRPGGDSQNVYLTSSIVDLSKFVGKKIKVWGQTQKAQYAGWLMDVGRVEAL